MVRTNWIRHEKITKDPATLRSIVDDIYFKLDLNLAPKVLKQRTRLGWKTPEGGIVFEGKIDANVWWIHAAIERTAHFPNSREIGFMFGACRKMDCDFLACDANPSSRPIVRKLNFEKLEDSETYGLKLTA